MMTWWNDDDGMLGLDLETTGKDPETARIVSYALVWMYGDKCDQDIHRLVNPGIRIPPEATAVHGITDDQVKNAIGTAAALEEISVQIQRSMSLGMPLVIFNAPYDLTVISSERKRLGLHDSGVGCVVDPYLMDRGIDRYRKGSRRLKAVCAHYGIKMAIEHNALGDALCAARLARAVGKKINMDIVSLQKWQEEMHETISDSLEAYRRKTDPNFTVRRGWPK